MRHTIMLRSAALALLGTCVLPALATGTWEEQNRKPPMVAEVIGADGEILFDVDKNFEAQRIARGV